MNADIPQEFQKRGALLGVRETREQAEQEGANWCAPGAYGNPRGEGDVVLVEPIERGDGSTVYGVWLGIART